MSEILIGRTIKNIRPMTKKECANLLWSDRNPVMVIELDNGVILYPSADYEGNEGGAIFGEHGSTSFTVYVEPKKTAKKK